MVQPSLRSFALVRVRQDGNIADREIFRFEVCFLRNVDRTAYDALSDDQKALVGNYETLTVAEQTYAALQAAAEQKAADDQAAAADAAAKIAAIGTVEYTDACKALIDAARTAYDALTDDQKALVENYETLTAAEQTYAALQAIATGITGIDADQTNDSEPWYTIGGAKLQGKPTAAGIYIRGGKKVVVK